MNNSNSFSHLLPNTGWALLSTILLIIAGFVLNVFIGNYFGEKGLGLYSLLTTVYLAIGTIASFGLPGAITKFSAEFSDTNKIKKKYYTAALLLGAILSTASAIILSIWVEPLAKELNALELEPLLLVVSFALPTFVVNKVMLAQLRGQKHLRSFAIGEIARSVLLVSLTIMFVFIYSSLSTLAWALVFTEFALLVLLFSRNSILRNLEHRNLKKYCFELINFGKQIIASRLMIELDSRFSILLIGYFLTTVHVGIFTIAFMATQALSIIPTTLQKVTGPIITRCYIDKNTKDLELFINQAMQTTSFLLTILAIILITLFPLFITFIFPHHPEFHESYRSTIILTIGLVFRGIIGAVGSVFVSVGRPDIVFKTSPIRLLSNISVSVALVGPLGIEGVALGTTTSALVIFLLWIFLIPRYLSIHINIFRICMLPFYGIITLIMIHILANYISLILSLTLCILLYSFLAVKFYNFNLLFSKSNLI